MDNEMDHGGLPPVPPKPQRGASADAKHRPVVTPAKELLDSRDIPAPARASVNLDVPREDQPEVIVAQDNEDDIVITDEGPMYGYTKKQRADYLAELAFMEEPVQIILQKSAEKFAPPVVDCWVNGRGAEMFVNGKWMVCGWLPVGVAVITRRKYVAVLAQAKADSVKTEVIQHKPSQGMDGYEDNFAHRFTQTKYPFSVLQDRSGEKGARWLAKLLQEQ